MNMSMDDLMTSGQKVYLAKCAACHMPNGEGLPGVFPAIKGSNIALNDRTGHIDILLNGRTGTAMQAFAKQLTLSEIAAVITYQRNAWGNNTGDIVQASEVHTYANGK
jgi:cytochrome c oxidase subunit 2